MLTMTQGFTVNPRWVIHIIFQSFLNYMIDHMDYPNQDFTWLRYSDVLTFIIQRGQSHLDSHTDFINIWLYSVAFCIYIRNTGSLTPKHSELFISHRSDLRLKEYLCPYPSWATVVEMTGTPSLTSVACSGSAMTWNQDKGQRAYEGGRRRSPNGVRRSDRAG